MGIQGSLKITPMAFAEAMYKIDGKPLRFGPGRRYLRPIHEADSEEILMMTGRQVEKTTTVSVKIANDVLLKNFSKSLYVAPLNEQVKTFSRARLDKLFRYSQKDLVRKRYKRSDLVDQVFHKEFANGAEVYLRNCYEDADNIRGLSIDAVNIDEMQDINLDAIPVILETQARSKNKRKVYTGTPKTLSNTIQQQWERSSQADWVIRCPKCGKHQVMGIESITPTHYQCLNKRCTAPIDDVTRAMGRWEHREKDKKMKGYRITQMMVPDMAASDIHAKLEEYPMMRVMNEIMGHSYEKADKPFTLTQLYDMTDQERDMLFTARDTVYANKPTYAGIDWGEGEKNGEQGTGYTAIVISSMGPDGTFDTIFAKRYERGQDLDPDYQLNDILKIINIFRCAMVIADYGAGVKENKRMRKKLGTRFLQCQYVGDQAKKITYDKVDSKVKIARSDWMTDYIEYASGGGVTFFGNKDEGVLKTIYDNFRALYSEYRHSRNGLSEKLYYGHDMTEPDDLFHCHLYSWLAFMISQQGLPGVPSGGGIKFASVHPNG